MPNELHINIDHIATVRNARRTIEPDLIQAVKIIEATQAKGITMHLREDRRHINDRDIYDIDAYIQKSSKLSFTFEMGATDEIKAICLKTKAKLATIVPEKREELTTEGGLNLIGQEKYLKEFIKAIKDNGTQISFFVDPIEEQITLAKEIGANFIEIHTGTYANLFIKYGSASLEPVQAEIARIHDATKFAQSIGLKVNLGHGLTVNNLPPLMQNLKNIQELHIGHSIIANSIYYGLENTIKSFLAVLA
ncbi:MAG: pyridoxine 5'-phosphate synthase [Candidatus Caenarcaniphilales bacterium]|jgi:pyridoxine 5-phosphate synthase|nr:pyridoxine 5'-phosphate synthase [Candidatus Caenarcaniphilales bacterium]